MGMFAMRRPLTVLLRESQLPWDGQPASPGTKRHPPAMGEIGLFTIAAEATGLLAARKNKMRSEESTAPLKPDSAMFRPRSRTYDWRVRGTAKTLSCEQENTNALAVLLTCLNDTLNPQDLPQEKRWYATLCGTMLLRTGRRCRRGCGEDRGSL